MISTRLCLTVSGSARRESAPRHPRFYLDGRRTKATFQKAAALIKDKSNQLFLSVVSVWVIQIKAQLGKLTLRDDLEKLVSEQQSENALEILPVLLPHTFVLRKLPLHHKDPFDRLLIAQALHEGFMLLSHDDAFDSYSVPVVWK